MFAGTVEAENIFRVRTYLEETLKNYSASA